MPTTIFWQDPDIGIIQSVRFDSVSSVSHDDNATITQHPVEEGVNIADHIRQEPNVVSIDGFFSNMPQRYDDDAADENVDIQIPGMKVGPPITKTLDIASPPIQPSPSGLIQAGIGAIKDAFSGPPKGVFRGKSTKTSRASSAQMLTQSVPRNRVRDAYELLLLAYENGYLCTVTTDEREHFDMAIERVSMPKTLDDGSGATVQVDLRKIRTAVSATVQSPQPAEARGSTNKTGGSKNGKDDPNGVAKEEEYSSTFNYLTGG